MSLNSVYTILIFFTLNQIFHYFYSLLRLRVKTGKDRTLFATFFSINFMSLNRSCSAFGHFGELSRYKTDLPKKSRGRPASPALILLILR